MTCSRLVTVCIALLATPAIAAAPSAPVVIDTDVGVDDVVALAIALQQPGLQIAAIVVTDGVASGSRGLEFVDRLLTFFNRRDIPLYGPARRLKKTPAFRAAAEATLDRLLPTGRKARSRPFSPRAYGGAVTLLALGPLTSFAAALSAEPSIGKQVKRVIFRGAPAAADSWNVRFDPAALAAVRDARVPVHFLRDSANTRKSARWLARLLADGASGAPAMRLLRSFFASAGAREHYLTQLTHFTDEIGLLALLAPRALRGRSLPRRWGFANGSQLLSGASQRRVLGQLTSLAMNGRFVPPSVVLARPLPAKALLPQLRQRRAAMIAAHGAQEWRAQVLMNELHQHLGIYSLIGVKMGVRATELLNAPAHAVSVASFAARRPPVSCLIDGVIVATGATPGRNLFVRRKGGATSTRVRFSFNRRAVTLQLRSSFVRQVNTTLSELRSKHGLDSPVYWQRVLDRGLQIWQRWHRRDLFDETIEDLPLREAKRSRPRHRH